MKASYRQQLLLLDLQQLDHTLVRLRRQLEQLPARQALNTLELEGETVRNTYMDAQRELDARRLELTRIEDDVRLVDERTKRDEELLAHSTSSKEAVALQSEMEVLARRKAELEDRQLEAMEVVETAERVFADAETVLAGVDERREAIHTEIRDAESEIQRERTETEEKRAGIAAEVRGDLLAHYEQLRNQIGIGAARLRGNVSEASGMALTPADLSGIRAADPEEVVYCPETGAILVRVHEEAGE